MNHPVLGIVVLFLTSGALAGLGFFFLKEWNKRRDD